MAFFIPLPYFAVSGARFRTVVSSYERGLTMLMSIFKEVAMTIGECTHQKAEEETCLKRNNKKKKPGQAFNLLDPLLKENLDRLKMIKDLSDGVSYFEEAVVRYLCLGQKVGPALWLRDKFVREKHIPSVSTHNHLIYELCRIGYLERAELLVKEMRVIGCPPNVFTYNTFIKGYLFNNDFDKALRTLSSMIGHGIRSNRHTRNIVLHALCKKDLLTHARVLLYKILNVAFGKESSDRITSTILLESFFKEGYVNEALDLWLKMSQNGVPADVAAYNVLIQGLCSIHEVKLAFCYLGEMFKKGTLPDIVTYNTFISHFCKNGRFNEALCILVAMPSMGVLPDLISYKVIIQSLCMRGNVVRAHELLNHMLENSVVPSTQIFNVIIDGYGQNGDLVTALSIRDQMEALGILPNIFTYSAVVYALSKGGNIGAAVSQKDEMMQMGLYPNLFTYNILIGASCCQGLLEFAFQLYGEMLKRGCSPNIITYTELMKGYCIQGQSREAEKIFCYMWRCGLEVDHFPYQILIEHYCKNGEPERVLDLCDKLSACDD